MKPSLPLTQKKNPKDHNQHLAHSITHHAVSGDDYGALKTAVAFRHRKTRHEQELAKEAAQKGFWKTLEHEIAEQDQGFVKIPEIPAAVPVKKVKHRRSPYVVRLHPHTKNFGVGVKPLRSAPSREEPEPDWRKEVERLRKDGLAMFKSKASKIRLNFLDPRRHRWLSLGLAVAAAALWPKRTAKWLYELLLSVPLGFLLLLHVILKLTEIVSSILVRLGRLAGRWTVSSVAALFLAGIAVGRASIAIPVKLIVIALLASYRVLGWAGLAAGRLSHLLADALAEPLVALKQKPTRVLGQLLGAAAVAALLLLPLKFVPQSARQLRAVRGQVLGTAREGLSALTNIGRSVQEGEAEAARENLAAAGLKFTEARDSLSELNWFLRSLVKLSPQGRGGEDLLAAAQELSRAGEELAAALAPFLSQKSQGAEALAVVKNLAASLAKVSPRLAAAGEKLAGIDDKIIPEEYRAKFTEARTLLPDITKAVSVLRDLAKVLLPVLGADGDKRYAVLFQNNNELRPAGGFIGSLALVTVREGRVSEINIPGGGSYDFQGYLTKHALSPKPLALINPHWQLQDSNWYPDWPTSAEKAAWFLENSGQTSVDGVIALQATTLQNLLRQTGPIDFPEYNVTLTADNVIREMQTAVELSYDKSENKPKQYIAELAPRLIDKILGSNTGQLADLVALVQDEIAAKNFLLYFRDKEINERFVERGWVPQVLQASGDYLSVIHANIGGGKTDGVISESWEQNITVSEDGTAVAELRITRRHLGDPNDHFEKTNNVDFVRVYAPLGSEFISGSGFKSPPAELFEKPAEFYKPDEQLSEIEGKVVIDEATGTRINNEFGKTAFGNWIQVAPGQTAVATIRYKLPFKIKPYSTLNPDSRGGYSLIIQKQAGARPIDYSVSIQYPALWQVAWKKTGGEGTIEDGVSGLVTFTGILARDTGFAALFTERD